MRTGENKPIARVWYMLCIHATQPLLLLSLRSLETDMRQCSLSGREHGIAIGHHTLWTSDLMLQSSRTTSDSSSTHFGKRSRFDTSIQHTYCTVQLTHDSKPIYGSLYKELELETVSKQLGLIMADTCNELRVCLLLAPFITVQIMSTLLASRV